MTRSAGEKRCGRRRLLLELAPSAAMVLLGGCGSGSSAPAAPAPAGARSERSKAPPRPFGGAVEVHSWFDFPEAEKGRELSGIAWDSTAHRLWAVQDESANIVPLVPDRALRSWTIGAGITLKMSFPLDLEGIVVLPDGFIVCSEDGPRILEVDRKGKLRRDVALPKHFGKARENKSLESLSMTPDGAHLFTTTEAALSCDGTKPTQAAGTLVRILRIPRAGGDVAEHAYATDPLPHGSGDYGVADLAALSSEDVLVLERGWSRGAGNTARIYRVSLADPVTSCILTPELSAEAPVLRKTLLVDLAKVVVKGLPPSKQKQDSPLLDNFEGLAIGPQLEDGRQTILLVSDDNARSDQFARIVVLAVG